jgi:hypothetical protein
MIKILQGFFIFTFIFFAACSARQTQDPSWLGKTWSDANHYYFSGISDSSYSLNEARQSAYLDALAKAAEYIGFAIDIKTTQSLNSHYADIQSNTKLTVKDTLFSQAEIKDFQYVQKNDNSYRAYILIEFKKSLIEAEKRRREELENQRLEKIAQRKSAGDVEVISPPELDDIKYAVIEFLEKTGYNIYRGGGAKKIPFKIIKVAERFGMSRYDIISYNFTAAATFDDMTKNISVVGFGNTRMQAVNDAHMLWLEKFKDEFEGD